jgi:hypothetical protein
MTDDTERGQSDEHDTAPCWWCGEPFTPEEEVVRVYGEDELLIFHPDHYERYVKFIERIPREDQ